MKKNVIITGGSSGIGKGIAEVLKNANYDVVITGRNKKKLTDTAKGLGITSFCCDVSNDIEMDALAKFLENKWQNIDILINNAGGYAERYAIEEVTYENLIKAFNTNVYGTILTTKKLLKLFDKEKGGIIINIGSTASNEAYSNGTIYVMTKFAVKGISRVWQYELSKHNIKVILVNPGDVVSSIIESSKRTSKEEDMLTPQEVGKFILNLVSQKVNVYCPEIDIVPFKVFQENEPFYK